MEARFKGHYAHAWLAHCRETASQKGYDLTALGVKERMTDSVNADFAASTQKLFEETMLTAVETLGRMAGASGLKTDNLCLSGGTALNCPSNSRIAREGPFRRVFVEPACDDSGLALGAALAAFHNVLDQEPPAAKRRATASAYLGAPLGDTGIAAALAELDPTLTMQAISDAPERAARELAANKVIGWFEGRSEIGPRALGHRSILADPRDGANWARVNRIKGREAWRPFAPAVLESEAAEWFVGAPLPSPYMLFTATVRSSAVPAITHKDGSARIQTVDESCGEFFHLLRAFYVLTKVPLVLNTSFNGPGEPIVETPGDALRFFAASELDALYLDGYRVARRARAAKATPTEAAPSARVKTTTRKRKAR
jgi:carbamoyltransferase